MNIGQAAAASGLSARMIRHYEAVGLLPATQRSEAGYRHYDQTQLHTLRFIQRSRNLGFSIEQITQLLSLWQDADRNSAEVKALTAVHLQELEEKIASLQAMHQTLSNLAECCQGDARPQCPILDTLGQINATD